MKIRTLFRSLEELDAYCWRNPDFPAHCGCSNPVQLWALNLEIPSYDN